MMSNLRRNPRNRVRLVATIKLGPGIATRHCLVTDISADGVCFNVNDLDDLDEFALSFKTRTGALARDGIYKVVWRNGNVGGAKLISVATPGRAIFPDRATWLNNW
jgi:hypothetical protein